MKSKNLYFAKSQQGIATVLTVALVGIALIVSIASTAYYLRTKQYAVASNHALIQEQANAWLGVEILQQYLSKLDKNDLDKLNDELDKLNDELKEPNRKSIDLPINNLPDNIIEITAKIDNIKKPTSESEPYRVTSTITSRNTISKSASTVQVVYEVKRGAIGTSNPSPLPNSGISAINIYTDVGVSGNVSITNSTGNAVDLNVVGNATLHEISNIDTLKVTGDLTVSNKTTNVNNIYADGNVTLKNPGAISVINTKKSIYLNGGNGSVEILKAGENIEWKNDTILVKYGYANKNITGAAHNTTLSNRPASGDSMGVQLKAGNQIDCDSNNYENIAAKSFTEKCGSANISNIQKILTSNELPVIKISELGTSLSITPPMVNANCYDPEKKLKCSTNTVYTSNDTANYIFEYKDNKITVRVYNLDGFTDGTTFCLGSSTISNISLQNTNNMQNSDHWGYLYEATVNGNSVNCSSTIKANIVRWYDQNKDQKMNITYDNGTWTIRRPNLNVNNYITDFSNILKTPSIAPGVILFRGDLKIREGIYNNTLLATGTIESSSVNGNAIISAPNYAATRGGVEGAVCHANSALSKSSNRIIEKLDPLNGYFPRPTNFCSSTTAMISPTTILGDLALLAGSYTGTYNKASYVGGDITLKSYNNNSPIYGNIIAGNNYETDANLNLYGFLSIIGLGNNRKTTLTDLKIVIPTTTNTNIGAPTEDSGTGNQSTPNIPAATIKWVRYL